MSIDRRGDVFTRSTRIGLSRLTPVWCTPVLASQTSNTSSPFSVAVAAAAAAVGVITATIAVVVAVAAAAAIAAVTAAVVVVVVVDIVAVDAAGELAAHDVAQSRCILEAVPRNKSMWRAVIQLAQRLHLKADTMTAIGLHKSVPSLWPRLVGCTLEMPLVVNACHNGLLTGFPNTLQASRWRALAEY